MQTLVNLFVQERQAGDEIVKSIKSRGDQVLAVVTEEFEDGKHGKAAVSDNGKCVKFKMKKSSVRWTSTCF